MKICEYCEKRTNVLYRTGCSDDDGYGLLCKSCLLDFFRFRNSCDRCGEYLDDDEECYIWEDEYFCERCFLLTVPKVDEDE